MDRPPPCLVRAALQATLFRFVDYHSQDGIVSADELRRFVEENSEGSKSARPLLPLSLISFRPFLLPGAFSPAPSIPSSPACAVPC